MFYILFYSFITISCESSVIKVINDELSGKISGTMEDYILKSMLYLTRQLPNKVIEIQLDYRAPFASNLLNQPPYRRDTKVLRHPINIKRSLNDKGQLLPPSTNTTVNNLAATTIQNPTSTNSQSDTTTTDTTTSTPSTTTQRLQPLKTQSESGKVPIYLDDLKRAFEEFAQKQTIHKDCNTNTIPMNSTIARKPLTAENLPQPGRVHSRIQDILQLIGKGIKVQYNVPEPTDDKLEWVKIKVKNEK